MQDVRLALRNLTNRPGFALGAILTLALGIGATTAVFTVLHGVLLAPLRYAMAALVLGLAALGASYLPARRAARASPLSALRR